MARGGGRKRKKPQEIGTLPKSVGTVLGVKLLTRRVAVVQSTVNHIRKAHPEDFAKYWPRVREIAENPDYAGLHGPTGKKFEIIKLLDRAVVIGLKIGTEREPLWISTLYHLEERKLRSRIRRKKIRDVNGLPTCR